MKWPTRCYVRAYILTAFNMAQPSMRLATYAERNLGYDRRQLRDAAGNLGVFITNIDGKPHWQSPDNVVAMWWNKR